MPLRRRRFRYFAAEALSMISDAFIYFADAAAADAVMPAFLPLYYAPFSPYAAAAISLLMLSFLSPCFFFPLAPPLTLMPLRHLMPLP